MATIRKLRGRWQAQVRRRGLAPRAKSFDQKSDAEKWARSLESELDRCGMLPDTRVAESTTLRSILERYMTEISPRKRSAHTEVSRIKALLRRPLCHRTLALLSTSDLATYRDDRLKTVSPSTVIRELNTISHAIDTAMRDWDVYLHRNPCKLVRRPSPPRGRNRRLRDDEEQRLLDAADTGRNIYMRDLIVLAIETGMRRGEGSRRCRICVPAQRHDRSADLTRLASGSGNADGLDVETHLVGVQHPVAGIPIDECQDVHTRELLSLRRAQEGR